MRLVVAVKHLEELGYTIRYAFHPSPSEQVKIIYPSLRGRTQPTVVMADETEYVVCRGFVNETELMMEVRRLRLKVKELTLQSAAADLVIEILEEHMKLAEPRPSRKQFNAPTTLPPVCGCGSPRCEADLDSLRAAGM